MIGNRNPDLVQGTHHLWNIYLPSIGLADVLRTWEGTPFSHLQVRIWEWTPFSHLQVRSTHRWMKFASLPARGTSWGRDSRCTAVGELFAQVWWERAVPKKPVILAGTTLCPSVSLCGLFCMKLPWQECMGLYLTTFFCPLIFFVVKHLEVKIQVYLPDCPFSKVVIPFYILPRKVWGFQVVQVHSLSLLGF